MDIVATRLRHAPFSGASRTEYTVAGQQPATMSPYRLRGISGMRHTWALGDPGIKGGRPHQEGGKSDGRGIHEEHRRSHILDANRTAAACRVSIVSFMFSFEPLFQLVFPAALEINRLCGFGPTVDSPFLPWATVCQVGLPQHVVQQIVYKT